MPLPPLPQVPDDALDEPVWRPRLPRDAHNTLEFGFNFAAGKYIARIMAATLGHSGHYVEFSYYLPSEDPNDLAGKGDDRITVTVQRHGRGALTPADARKSAERELERAMGVLDSLGIPFQTTHDFGPGPDRHRDDVLFGPMYDTGVVIKHDVLPHELRCETCGARQTFPDEWTYPVFHAMVQAFAESHEYGVCRGGTRESWEAAHPRQPVEPPPPPPELRVSIPGGVELTMPAAPKPT